MTAPLQTDAFTRPERIIAALNAAIGKGYNWQQDIATGDFTLKLNAISAGAFNNAMASSLKKYNIQLPTIPWASINELPTSFENPHRQVEMRISQNNAMFPDFVESLENNAADIIASTTRQIHALTGAKRASERMHSGGPPSLSQQGRS